LLSQAERSRLETEWGREEISEKELAKDRIPERMVSPSEERG
jgi:hypothetical protein